MKAITADIPTTELLDSLSGKCTGIRGNKQFFQCMATDEGGAEIEPIYYSDYWCKNTWRNCIDMTNDDFKYHTVAYDGRYDGKRSYAGSRLECKQPIRPILKTDTIQKNENRYRIDKYVFEPILNTKLLICTSFIGISTYADNVYTVVDPHDHRKDIIRPDAHDYDKSNVKKIIDEWFETKIKNQPIITLSLTTVTIDINTTVFYTDWTANADEAKLAGKNTINENLITVLNSIEKITT